MADIEDSKKEIELLNDAIVSLSEKIKTSLDKSLRGVDKTTRKIANVFKNDLSKSADRVTDSLKNQDEIQAAINQGQDQSKKISKEIVVNEARKETILRNANLLRSQGIDFDEESVALLVAEIDSNVNNLDTLKEKNIESQRERDFLKEGFEKLKNNLSVRRLIRLAITATVNALKDGSELTANIAKNTGLSAERSLQLQKNFANLAANSNEVFINSKRLNESFGKLSSETGIISSFGGDTLVSFTQLTEQLGLGVKEATQLSLISRLQGTNTKSTLKDTVATVNAINQQNGVNLSAKEIFNDISSASSAIVVSLGMNPQLLAEAAAEAKSLGSNLSQVEQISESLMNFETSISNELNAELLTGKQLNFEKARLLALNNDLAGVSKELMENEELFSSFANGNRITQQAIADTIGLSRDQMADMVKQQQFLQLGAEGFTAEYGEQTYQQMLQLSASQKLAESMTKLQSALVDLVTPLIPIIDAFSNVISGVASFTSMVVSGGPSSQRTEFDYDRMASAMSNVQVNTTTNYSGFHSKSSHAMRGSYSTDIKYNKSKLA